MKVKCIDSGSLELTNGKFYDVIRECGQFYILIDDDLLVDNYKKDRFEIIEEESPLKSNIKEITDLLRKQLEEVEPMLRDRGDASAVGQIGGTHYGNNDTIQFARDNFPPEQLEGFFRINAIKYVDRYDRKNGVEDLKKAQHYLQMLIELKS